MTIAQEQGDTIQEIFREWIDDKFQFSHLNQIWLMGKVFI